MLLIGANASPLRVLPPSLLEGRLFFEEEAWKERLLYDLVRA